MKRYPFALTFDPTKEKGITPHIAAKRLQCSRQNIYRLVNSGHLRSFRPGPQTILVSELSVAEYAGSQVSDPEFWDKPENLERFRKANGLPSRKSRIDGKTDRPSTSRQAR